MSSSGSTTSAGRTVIGSIAVASGPSRCSRPRTPGHDHGRAAVRVAQPPQQLEALAHRLDRRADPLERQRLPCREHGDLVGGQELGEVVAELGGHRAGRAGHDERAGGWTATARAAIAIGPGDLDDGEAGVGLAEGARQRRLVAQQRGEIGQSHGASRVPTCVRRSRRVASACVTAQSPGPPVTGRGSGGSPQRPRCGS